MARKVRCSGRRLPGPGLQWDRPDRDYGASSTSKGPPEAGRRVVLGAIRDPRGWHGGPWREKKTLGSLVEPENTKCPHGDLSLGHGNLPDSRRGA